MFKSNKSEFVQMRRGDHKLTLYPEQMVTTRGDDEYCIQLEQGENTYLPECDRFYNKQQLTCDRVPVKE